MTATNVLLIMSDEHDPRHIGVSGNSTIQTPALDRLSENGVRFTNAYTPSPICVPARASFATGRYVNDLPYWDNALGYDGQVRGWGHRLQEKNIRCDAIGKLHYRQRDDPLGFDYQIDTMHIKDGIGQVWGSIRDPLPEVSPPSMFNRIGAGVSNYNLYDRQNANSACEWLDARARSKKTDHPWMLYVGLAAPHFPLVVPRAYLDRYPPECVPPRKLHPGDGHAHHPWIQAQEQYMSQEKRFADEAERNLAIRAYYGLCSFLDDQIGMILDALSYTGLAENTLVLYTSDHGDNLGARGLWGKSNLYEESVKIPMIMSGPGVPKGRLCSTPVSLVDCYPTILQATGVDPEPEQRDLRGISLLDLARQPDNMERTVISEYHAVGSVSGAFMLRKGNYKYHHYVGMAPELFDLEKDPEETVNQATNRDYQNVLADCEAELREFLDPERVDQKAKAAQSRLIEKFGGREKALKVGTPGATPVPSKSGE